jgi:hypothetical protein
MFIAIYVVKKLIINYDQHFTKKYSNPCAHILLTMFHGQVTETVSSFPRLEGVALEMLEYAYIYMRRKKICSFPQLWCHG